MATVQLGQATLYTEDPAARRTWQALEARYTPELDLLAPARPRVLQLGQGLAHNKNLVVKRPTLVNYTALINVYHDSLAAVPALAGLALGPARTWFTAEAITAPMSDRIRDALVSRTQAGRGVPLIVHPPASMPGVGTAGDSAIAAAIHAAQGLVPAKVTFTEYRPRRLSLTAVVERDGWLFVTDRWAPGWRATVDRKPVPIWGANAVFRAVRVHAGSNAVQFDYRPAGLPILLALSWGLLAAALVSAGGRWLLRSGGAQRAVEEAGAARASAPDISLIIPSYDSAAYIGRSLAALVEHVERHGWDAEILVIDDGSSDSTPAIVRGAIATHGERVRLLHHARNAGKGAAVRSGMLAAHGRRRVFTDSDLPYSLQDLSAVVAALGEADVVVGSRGGPKMSRIGSRKRGAAGPGRGSASRWFSRLATRAFRLPVEDPQCGLKGFTAEAAQRIFHRASPRAQGAGGAGDAPAPGRVLGAHPPALDPDAGRARVDPPESAPRALSLAIASDSRRANLAREDELPAVGAPALLQAQEIDARRKFLTTGVASVPGPAVATRGQLLVGEPGDFPAGDVEDSEPDRARRGQVIDDLGAGAERIGERGLEPEPR
jgi:hypothetical protein